MNSHLIKEKDLFDWLNLEGGQRAALERYMRKNGIKIIHGKDGSICTTLEAINKALGVTIQERSTNEVEFL